MGTYETSKDEITDLIQEEQEANAFLRNRFLQHVISLCGNKTNCKINMFENSEVSADIKAVDLNFENMIVENLVTPRPGPIKIAVLRTSDILTISYK